MKKEASVYDAFKGAKELLSKGPKYAPKKVSAICYALDDWVDAKYRQFSNARWVADQAKKIVMARLYPFRYAPDWIRTKLKEFPPNDRMRLLKGNYEERLDIYQAWRHAWLDQLIAEFKPQRKKQL